jgi:hypothetical protein
MSQPSFDPWRQSRAQADAKLPRLWLALMTTCVFGTSCLCPASEDDEEFRRLAKKEVEDGTAVASKPKLRVSAGALYVDRGAIAYEGSGSKGGLEFKPMQNQLRLELLRQYAFPDEPDRSAAAPFFDDVERQIQRQRETVRADRPPDVTRDDLRAIDRKIDEQTDAAIQAVARARGLQRHFVTRPAYPGWSVTVAAPSGTLVRYTPYLNYTLNSKPGSTVDWSTAQDGDVLKLRGRYRFELLRAGEVIESRVPVILKEEAVRFE